MPEPNNFKKISESSQSVVAENINAVHYNFPTPKAGIGLPEVIGHLCSHSIKLDKLITIHCDFDHYVCISEHISNFATNFLLWTMQGAPQLQLKYIERYNRKFNEISNLPENKKIRFIIFTIPQELDEYINNPKRDEFETSINESKGKLYFSTKKLITEYFLDDLRAINLNSIKLDIGYVELAGASGKESIIFQGNWSTDAIVTARQRLKPKEVHFRRVNQTEGAYHEQLKETNVPKRLEYLSLFAPEVCILFENMHAAKEGVKSQEIVFDRAEGLKEIDF